MSRNNISTLEFTHLPVTKKGILEVHLQGNPIQKVNFGKEDYELLRSNSTVNLTVIIDSKLDCDCHGAWFARSLREQHMSFDNVRCADDVLVVLYEPSRLECDKYNCGACTCRRSWHDNTTRVNCKPGELHTWPRVPLLIEVHASNNLIETIHMEDLSDTLIFLDLSNNRIARVDSAVAETLFAVPERRMRLSYNPLVCDCDNKPFLDALKNHHNQIEDYSNITCVGDGRTLQDLDTEMLCNAKKFIMWIVLLATGGMLVGLATFIGALYCRYAQSIKIFLYARGICLCCMAEDELDTDRQYDAFISFTHEDEKFVIENLLPELEKTYKICVHFRDWIVGDMILTQITRSVESSRRTIVVLSKKFVKSLWGMLEFRTAHITALSEGRVRVIVVIIDDVAEDNTLDVQLRSYLRTNTYLKWGDPWFWDKLKYAMPRLPPTTITNPRQVNATRVGQDAIHSSTLVRRENQSHTDVILE
ncbi:protein toll-like [Hyposmocoma kahamanoa]|uniref:protein toll-like n=1 Tax=Hyposmocoma kahamanoa TaxID=1477025 RepID=UPI000E6D96C3|nr:protein toll-like [Hyposmocoma kahamanoa]